MSVELSPIQAAALAAVASFGAGFVVARYLGAAVDEPKRDAKTEGKKEDKKDNTSDKKNEGNKDEEKKKAEAKKDKKDAKKDETKKDDNKENPKEADTKKEFEKKAEAESEGSEGDESSESSEIMEDWERDDANSEPCKLVLAVRMDLGMERGKVAAQCSHATLGAYKQALKNHPEHVKAWSRNGQAKITVKINGEEEMMTLYDKAKAAGLTAHIVVDAGRTQIAAGSRTILAVGPAPNSLVDTVTGKLKLY